MRNLKPRSISVETEATVQSCNDESPSSSSQNYAIKKLREDIPDSMQACGRIDLAVEAQFLKTLSHPNIVSLRGVGEEPGNKDFFLILERIERTLATELHKWRVQKYRMKSWRLLDRSEHSLFVDDRIAVARQLTGALKYLHDKK